MATDFKLLIEENKELEDRASKVQREGGSHESSEYIHELVTDYNDWYARALDALPEGFEDRFREEFKGPFWATKIKDFLDSPTQVSPLFDPEAEPNPLISRWQAPFVSVKEAFAAQRQILAEARQKIEGPGESSQHLVLLEKLCRRLPELLTQLKNRGRGRPPFVVEDEYDVQTVLHGVLRMFYDDVRPEDYSPEQAGSKSRVDFLLKLEKVVVETKMTRSGLGAKQVGEELIIDINRYKSHPDCGALVAMVYDPERYIDNPKALEHDLSKRHDGLTVRVFIVQ